METVGWEIRPAGWIALLILISLLIYFLIYKPQHPSKEDKNNPHS